MDRVRGVRHLQATGRTWLVESVLLASRPCLAGGPEKCLKTNLAVDMAVSLASGTPFLGRFKVPRPVRVLYYSGESGEDDIRSMVERMRRVRSLELFPPEEADPLAFNYNAVPLGEEQIGPMLSLAVQQHQAEVLFIDPLYLSLGLGGVKELQPQSLFDVGSRLRRATIACAEVGCTIVFVHHTKAIKLGQRPDLFDLQYAGFKQYARQWILVNRAAKYQGDGLHELILAAGAGAGHSSIWSLTVDEGKVDDTLTDWKTVVRAYKGTKANKKTGARASAKELQVRKDADKIAEAIKRLSAEGSTPTQKELKVATGITSGSRFSAAMKVVKAGSSEVR